MGRGAALWRRPVPQPEPARPAGAGDREAGARDESDDGAVDPWTEDELKQLVGWLESPVIRRYQQLTPEIQKGLSEKLVAETRALVEPKLQALDRSVSGRLGMPPPAKAASAPAKK